MPIRQYKPEVILWGTNTDSIRVTLLLNNPCCRGNSLENLCLLFLSIAEAKPQKTKQHACIVQHKRTGIPLTDF